jgi:hypothetical protein
MKNFDFEAAITHESIEIGWPSLTCINLAQIGYPNSHMTAHQFSLGREIVVQHTIPFLNLDDVDTIEELKRALARRLYDLVGDKTAPFEWRSIH